jgi:hypothetical protein
MRGAAGGSRLRQQQRGDRQAADGAEDRHQPHVARGRATLRMRHTIGDQPLVRRAAHRIGHYHKEHAEDEERDLMREGQQRKAQQHDEGARQNIRTALAEPRGGAIRERAHRRLHDHRRYRAQRRQRAEKERLLPGSNRARRDIQQYLRGDDNGQQRRKDEVQREPQHIEAEQFAAGERRGVAGGEIRGNRGLG